MQYSSVNLTKDIHRDKNRLLFHLTVLLLIHRRTKLAFSATADRKIGLTFKNQKAR